jgi:DNA-binding MarR family transcriptional regulator
MTLPLTAQQEKLWRYIASCDRSPTVDEMSEEMGYAHKGGAIVNLLNDLEKRGFIRRIPNRARSIVALDPTIGLSPYSTSELLAELEKRGILLTGQARE